MHFFKQIVYQFFWCLQFTCNFYLQTFIHYKGGFLFLEFSLNRAGHTGVENSISEHSFNSLMQSNRQLFSNLLTKGIGWKIWTSNILIVNLFFFQHQMLKAKYFFFSTFEWRRVLIGVIWLGLQQGRLLQ